MSFAQNYRAMLLLHFLGISLVLPEIMSTRKRRIPALSLFIHLKFRFVDASRCWWMLKRRIRRSASARLRRGFFDRRDQPTRGKMSPDTSSFGGGSVVFAHKVIVVYLTCDFDSSSAGCSSESLFLCWGAHSSLVTWHRLVVSSENESTVIMMCVI